MLFLCLKSSLILLSVCLKVTLCFFICLTNTVHLNWTKFCFYTGLKGIAGFPGREGLPGIDGQEGESGDMGLPGKVKSLSDYKFYKSFLAEIFSFGLLYYT